MRRAFGRESTGLQHILLRLTQARHNNQKKKQTQIFSRHTTPYFTGLYYEGSNRYSVLNSMYFEYVYISIYTCSCSKDGGQCGGKVGRHIQYSSSTER